MHPTKIRKDRRVQNKKLFEYVEKKDYDGIQSIFEHQKLSPDIRNDEGKTLLEVAMSIDDNNQALLLVLAEKPNVNLLFSDGSHPLAVAKEKNNQEAIDALEELDADEDFEDDMIEAEEKLFEAIRKNSPEDIEKLLFEDGVNVNSARSYIKETPVEMAVVYNKNDALKTLLENGADPDVFSHDDKPPIETAKGIGNDDAFRMLEEHGAKCGGSSPGFG